MAKLNIRHIRPRDPRLYAVPLLYVTMQMLASAYPPQLAWLADFARLFLRRACTFSSFLRGAAISLLGYG
jgi:hypothetical protein